MSNRRLNNGTVLNANTRITPDSTNSDKYDNYGIYVAMIIKAIPKGDKNNRWKKGVEYEAVMCSGRRQGEAIRHLVPLCSFGGKDNFNEVVYQPKTKTINGQDKGSSTPPEHTDGSYVLISFINGHYNHPVIIGGWPQPNNSQYGATEDDGIRILGQFQNLRWNIDKGGNLKVSFNDTYIELRADGNVNIHTSANTNIHTEADADIYTKGSTQIYAEQEVNIEGAAGDVNVNSGKEINIKGTGGNVTITASGGAVNANGSTGISFTGPIVNLGSAGATEKGVLGTTLQSILDNHTHNGSPKMDQSIGPALSSKIKIE